MTDQEKKEVAIVVAQAFRNAFAERFKGREGSMIRPKQVIEMLDRMIEGLPQLEPTQDSIVIATKKE